MKRGLRNTSLLLAMSIVIPALYASERPASLPTERVYAMTNDATKNEDFRICSRPRWSLSFRRQLCDRRTRQRRRHRSFGVSRIAHY